MCGIFGYINGDTSNKADVNITRTLVKKQSHRGPDDEGFFSDGNYAVSHIRLSIIDLSENGRQPMQNGNGDISIVLNGEIYNYRELKAKYNLESKFIFKSKTDVEVALYLYELLGIEFLNQLNGMFALAIWDRRSRQLILARDRFGIKPMFYSISGNSFWFSSEIKSLTGIPEFEKRINTRAVYNYFSFDYIPGEDTAYENILEVRPGHYLMVSSGKEIKLSDNEYWKPVYGNTDINDNESVYEKVFELLRNSVSSQLVSDVPVGVMLSGGLDSSAIAVLMSIITGNKGFHSFSLSFNEPSFDESRYARQVASQINTHHHIIKITPEVILNNFENYLYFIDEPYADGSAIPTFVLSREAKKVVTVLLSGEGGDEVFAGYDTYKAFLFNQRFRKMPVIIRSLIKYPVSCLPVSFRKLSFDYKARKFVNNYNNSIPVCHFLWREVFSEDDKRKLLNFEENLLKYNQPSAHFYSDIYNNSIGGDEINKLLAIDCTYHLPDDLMIKNDRMTMANSVEARVPFTDYVLYDYMAKISGRSKMKNNQAKYILKKIMSPYLPDDIINKKKIGLEIPYSLWLCNELKGLLLDYLSPDSLMNIPFMNKDYVAGVIDLHMKRKKDNGRELWGLLNFVSWYKKNFH